jgi:hypothetical protein
VAKRPITRNRRGKWTVNLPAAVAAVVRSLGGELRELLTIDSANPNLRRLFPTAYAGDPDHDAFYQLMARDGLVEGRLAAVTVLEKAMDGGELEESEMHQLMGALNDVRLVLGTALDVSEDDDGQQAIDETDPRSIAVADYQLLGFLLELVVEALMDTIPPEGTGQTR